MGLVLRVEETTAGVFGDIGLMNCEPVKIEFTDNAEPYRVSTARKVRPKVKEELDHLLERIIEEVTEPNDWCAPMVPVVTAVSDNTRPALSKAFQYFRFYCDVNQTVTVASTVFVK